MEAIINIAQFIANNLFNQLAIMMAIIALIGLLFQKKSIEQAIAGALRAAIGVIILNVGVSVFTGELSYFTNIMSSAFGMETPQATGNMNQFILARGGDIALVVAFSFILHVILVRIFNTKYVYLTAHLIFWLSVLVCAAIMALFPMANSFTLICSSSVIMAIYMTVQPLLMEPMIKKLTGKTDFGYAHTTAAGTYLSMKVGMLLGKKHQRSTEDIKLPKRLDFFKDINVSSAILVGLVMLISVIFADKEIVAQQAANYDASISPWVWAIIVGLRFAAGLAILLFGVRTFLAEIVPAFKGISMKVIPGAKPGLDCPAIYPYAPTAVQIGFISATVVYLVLMILMAAVGWFTIPPSVLFFGGAACGIAGGIWGGVKGAVIGGAIDGAFMAIGMAITWPLLASTAPQIVWIANEDYFVVAVLLNLLAKPFTFLGEYGVWAIVSLFFLLGLAYIAFYKKKQKKAMDNCTQNAET